MLFVASPPPAAYNPTSGGALGYILERAEDARVAGDRRRRRFGRCRAVASAADRRRNRGENILAMILKIFGYCN